MRKRLAFLVCYAFAMPARADVVGVPLKDSLPHMTTTGEASAEVMPDQAEVSLGVTQERKTADEATDATAKAAGAVIAAIKAQGIEPGDIQTSFSLSETYDTKKDDKGNFVSRTPRGYEAGEHVAVRVHDIAKVGPLTRVLTAKGAISFEGTSFTYSKARQKHLDLDSEAMRDALQQARIYTDAIGLKLGRVLQIGEDPSALDGAAKLPSHHVPPIFPDFSGSNVPVEPGLQRLRASVTVIWELEGKAK